jgi:hypothetical protein
VARNLDRRPNAVYRKGQNGALAKRSFKAIEIKARDE